MVAPSVLLVVVCFGLGQETITLLKFTDHTFLRCKNMDSFLNL